MSRSFHPLHPPLVRALLAAAAVQVAASGFAAPPSLPFTLDVGGGRLRVEFCTEDVVRVAFAPEAAALDRRSLAAGERRCEPVELRRTETTQAVTLASRKLQARVERASGRVSFLDPAGRPVLAEQQRSIEPAQVQGERTYHVRQQWQENAGETLHGLGQQQLGLGDLKGYDLDLWQHNATVVVPVLVSSRGYGILWDNTSFTRFGELREWTPIPPAQLLDAAGQSRRAHRQLSRRAGVREGRRDARRPADRHQDRRRDEAGEPADPPRAPGRGADRRALGGLLRPRGERRAPVPTLLERRDPDVGRRPARRRPLAPGLAALVRPRQAGAREGKAPRAEDRVVEGPGHGDAAAHLEAAGRAALDVAVVRGGGWRRLLLRLRSRARPRGGRLPPADRPGADAAALGLRTVAEPAALRDPAAERRRGRRLPLARESRSTRSCRTGSTGPRTPGVRTASTRLASRTPTAG